MSPDLLFFLAGLVGSAIRAWATEQQATFSRRSIGDVVIGGIMGILIPAFGRDLMPAQSTVIVQAAVVAAVSYAGASLVQNVIGRKLSILLGKDAQIKCSGVERQEEET